MTVVGELALWVALFLTVWGSVASFAGATFGRSELVTSGARSIVATAGMVTLACLGLWTALLSHDFSLEYVVSHTTLNTPMLYLVTAFWAGRPGTMLSFALALSVCSAATIWHARSAHDERRPWVVGVLAAILALVLLAICLGTNPYDSVEWVPAEGQGLDPPLQNPLAAPYYLATSGAYGGAAVSCALWVAAARARKADAGWAASVHRWTLVTWCLLSLSVALRTRWGYLEPAIGFSQADLATMGTIGAWILSFVVLRAFGARGGARPPRAALLAYGGVVIVVAGIAATRSWTDRSVNLRPGEATELTDPYRRRWRFVSQGVSRDERMNYLSTGAALEAWRNGRSAGIISAERRQYLDSMQRPMYEPALKPGVRSSLELDMYVVLTEVRGETARLRVGFRPLVACVWIGWFVIAVGGLALGVGLSRRRVPRADEAPPRAA